MNELNRCKPLLGTYVEVSLKAELSDFELVSLSNRMFERISNIQTEMSFHDEQSLLSQINNQLPNSPVYLSQDYVELFSTISNLNSHSQEYFDPCIAPSLMRAEVLPNTNSNGALALEADTSLHGFGSWQDLEFENNQLIKRKPLMIDLGGIAKGYAVDKAIELTPRGVDACVNAGGDLRFTHWQHQIIGVKHGQFQGQSCELNTTPVNMLAPAVATTSAYYQEGVSHVVNPKNGVLQDDVRTYSVFAPTCVLADGLTKLACLLAADHKDKLQDILTTFDATLVVMD